MAQAVKSPNNKIEKDNSECDLEFSKHRKDSNNVVDIEELVTEDADPLMQM